MNSQELLDLIPRGLLFWYKFKPDSTVLLLGKKASTLKTFIKGCSITEIEDDVFSFDSIKPQKYDYIVIVSNLFFENSLDTYIFQLKEILNEKGQVLLTVNNDLGTRMICGDEQQKFNGTTRLLTADNANITRRRLLSIIRQNYDYCESFSVFPCLEYPQLIIRSGYMPNEKISNRINVIYNNPHVVFKQESGLIDFFQENEMIDDFANSLIFIFSDSSVDANVNSITMSLNRGFEKSGCTIIRQDGTVEKKAFFPEKNCIVQSLLDNSRYLRGHGINMVDGKIDGNSYVMPYINAPTADKYLFDLAFSDKEKFIKMLDDYVKIVLSSSETVDNSELGPILKKGFIDLVPLNCFVIDDKFVFFDQEFFMNDLPANVIILRSLIIIYGLTDLLQRTIPIEFFYKRYGLDDILPELRRIESNFLMELRNEHILSDYFSNHCISEESLSRNKNLLALFESKLGNDDEYVDSCFEGLEDKKVFLFGAGKYARKFIALYGRKYEIVQILDNDPAKWKTKLNGILINSPESLNEAQFAYKVIICMKNYEQVLRQLLAMQILHIGIYNAKDRVGYLSGVFDLYHIGHVNMFRRAKEQCDYLIVGVTSDEYVMNKKQRIPFIPCDERMQVIRSCRYVDKVVKVPYMHEEITEAWEKYHYDIQFCGSDYEHNPWWLEQQKWLREHGADLVFFPYTEQTSSTKIKALIEKGLL